MSLPSRSGLIFPVDLFQKGKDIQLGDEIVGLEYKAQLLPTIFGKLFAVVGTDVASFYIDMSLVQMIQTAEHIQQGAFARAGGTEDDADLAFFNGKAGVGERIDGGFPASVLFGCVFDLYVHD